MFNLPADMLFEIYEFDSFKRDMWKTVTSQFMKGGFNHKNLCVDRYINRQKWCMRKVWEGTRLNLSPLKGNVYILVSEWSCENKSALYLREYTLRRGGVIKRVVNSGANPVSTWLTNIARFESIHPERAAYLHS